MKAQQSRNNHATMKKTKKITNLHDYSKEVDKIIATKKPIVEQFMDLMGLMDVTFIDENQTNNRRLNKHDKSVQDKQTSDCCGAEVLSVQGYPKDEGTHYWQCSKCGRPCNIMNPCGSQTKRKRDATTGSTAKVHLNKQIDWRDKYLDKFKTTPHKGIDDFITQLLSTQRKEILFEVGNKFWHWYNNGTELIEDVIKEITGVGGEHLDWQKKLLVSKRK